MRICEYGFGEIVNNAIDHSEGRSLIIKIERTYANIAIFVMDDGVGIFDKITRDCQLTDKHEAILELSKGKLTTDRSRHTGEGIFFTSRMFDEFMIVSGGLAYARQRQTNGEYLLDTKVSPYRNNGTMVQMDIATNATQEIKGIFDQYLGDEFRFTKTVIPLKLAQYEGEHLVSRSQARRIMMRAEKFTQVFLDFSEITEIGQQFADEIFRVWGAAHPQVKLSWYAATPDVEKMVRHALANASEDAQLSLGLEAPRTAQQ
jgi:anti-sigma regulatory factor (Ser/Thr protein kinase)